MSSRSVQAAQYARDRRVSIAVAARAFGLTYAPVYVAYQRAGFDPRAEQAARHAHDHHVTRRKAAQLHGVPEERVIAAWERLYPDEPRIRT